MQPVWVWIKKYWEWLGGLVILAIGYFFGVIVRKKTIVTPAPSPVEKKAQDDVQKGLQTAQQKHEVQQRVATEEHASNVAEVVAKEEREAYQLINDQTATNEYLKAVGQSVRGNDNDK